MTDDLSNIHVGDTVKIVLQSNPSKYYEGKIFQILVDSNTDKKLVVLEDGSRGYILNIINSIDTIKKRIMTETQHTENKSNFFTDVMQQKSSPYAIQSFLNSDGGYLDIRVQDAGTLQERLVGLEDDFKALHKESKNQTNDELCDNLERRIRSRLESCLQCNIQIDSLLEFNFIKINDIQILEIKIKKSSKPIFFNHISQNTKKPKKFQLHHNNEHITDRTIDDFYIRNRNKKKLLSTHQEFYNYAYKRQLTQMCSK